ncbi:hypothetical protein [Actinobacillus capsulatus]|uniref:hypothetical protein n=1 Tax=Actinobacillus capsulatus TaxID=717 RepID=UPI00037405F7|nr:hypothetical protein [Actinobacillus capsulatus]
MKFELSNIYVENILFIVFFGAFIIGNDSFYLKKKGVASSYTRKINHFGLSLVSIIAFSNIPLEDTTKNAILSSILILFVYMLSSISKYRWISAIMESNVRERDMPNGKFFVFLPLITGQIALYISLIYLNPVFAKIAFCSMGFSDGLAEPIGVRFGKHKYTVRDFLWKKGNTKL